MKETTFIFDLDGTLYHFDGKPGMTFGESQFCKDMLADTRAVIADRLGVDTEEAAQRLQSIMEKYQGELSIGLEAEYGIDRYELFETTWGRNAGDYIESNGDLPNLLAPFAGRAALLTAAPGVWATNVLEYLGVADVFAGRVYSGEPDLRKPNPEIFRVVADALTSDVTTCLSIGDQNFSDILPAKSIGMQTALIGPEQLDADFFAANLPDLVNLITEKGMI